METNTYDFAYQVVECKHVKIDLDLLATILLDDFSDDELDKIREHDDIDSILTYFGDNTRVFLYRVGLPPEDDPDYEDLDFFFNEVYDALYNVIEKHLNEKF